MKKLIKAALELQQAKELLDQCDIDTSALGAKISEISSKLMEEIDRQEEVSWFRSIGLRDIDIAGILAYFSVTSEKDCAAKFISFVGLDKPKPHNNDARRVIVYAVKELLKGDNVYSRVYYEEAQKACNSYSPTHAHARAERAVQKIFISHIFEEMYGVLYKNYPERWHDNSAVIIPPDVPYTNS